MKTFLQTLVTDQWVTLKVGLLVAKMKAPGSVMNNRTYAEFLRVQAVGTESRRDRERSDDRDRR